MDTIKIPHVNACYGVELTGQIAQITTFIDLRELPDLTARVATLPGVDQFSHEFCNEWTVVIDPRYSCHIVVRHIIKMLQSQGVLPPESTVLFAKFGAC